MLYEVITNHRRFRHLRSGTIVVVRVGELVTGTDALHAEVFVGADGVARAQTADVDHDLLAGEARLDFLDDRLADRVVLGDDRLDLRLDAVVEELGELAQRLLDLGLV